MDRGLWTEFNAKYQDFQTSRISAQEFALYLKEFIEHRAKGKGQRGVHPMPSALTPMLRRLSEISAHQKTLRDIEGTQFFEDFEHYAQSVKESLMTTDEQRKLDAETHELNLMEKLVKLELSRAEWSEFKEGGRRKEEGRKDSFSDLSLHFAFYENAEKREVAFLKNLEKLLSSSHPSSFLPLPSSTQRSALLVAGGFHTEGLTEQFKNRGISYLLLMPHMDAIPEHSNYSAHMHGDVSWKDYFEVENGRVNLYKAFVRGTRDRLLRSGSPQSIDHSPQKEQDSNEHGFYYGLSTMDYGLAKQWRDQIIRDLAAKGKITQAQKYTQFIDEVAEKDLEDKWRNKWLANIEKFIEGLNQLEVKGRLNEQNVLKLLQPSTTVSTVAAVLTDAWVPAPFIGREAKGWDGAAHIPFTGDAPGAPSAPTAAAASRSEVRAGIQNLDDFLQALRSKNIISFQEEAQIRTNPKVFFNNPKAEIKLTIKVVEEGIQVTKSGTLKQHLQYFLSRQTQATPTIEKVSTREATKVQVSRKIPAWMKWPGIGAAGTLLFAIVGGHGNDAKKDNGGAVVGQSYP